MQIVIDIPEDKFDLIRMAASGGVGGFMGQIIANGTPLPKGHGRLIDESLMNDDNTFSILEDDGTLYRKVTDLPTVIPEDKEGD